MVRRLSRSWRNGVRIAKNPLFYMMQIEDQAKCLESFHKNMTSGAQIIGVFGRMVGFNVTSLNCSHAKFEPETYWSIYFILAELCVISSKSILMAKRLHFKLDSRR